MDNIIIRSKIKEFVHGKSISADFPDALNEKVVELIRNAAERAQKNGRRTLMSRDL